MDEQNTRRSVIRDFNVAGKPVDVQELLSRQKFISKMKDNLILTVGGPTLSPNTWFNKFCRYLNNMVQNPTEGRDQSLTFIQTVCDDSLECILHFLQSKDHFERDVGKLILDGLKEVRPGILSQATTYKSDTMFVSKVETFVKLLDAKIIEIENRFFPKIEGTMPDHDSQDF